MTPEEAAAKLNGGTYGDEGSDELFEQMKAAGLVAVFGGSDDLMEFRGAIDDEIGASGGGEAFVDANGLVKNECDEEDDCPNWKPRGKKIEAIWNPGDPPVSWMYKTDIPHQTFDIMDEGEPFCRGIVFKLADCA